MEDFYNKTNLHNNLHINNIKKKNFCTICYKLSNHNIFNCPFKCKYCNGDHKTEEHRCSICNIKNPLHSSKNCTFYKFNSIK